MIVVSTGRKPQTSGDDMTGTFATDAQIAAFQRVVEARDYVSSPQHKFVSRITVIKMAINVTGDADTAASFNMSDIRINIDERGKQINAFMERAVELVGIKSEFMFCYKPVTEDGMNSVLVWLGQQPESKPAIAFKDQPESRVGDGGYSTFVKSADKPAELEDGMYRRPRDGEIFKVYHTQKGHQVAKHLFKSQLSNEYEFVYEGKRPLGTLTAEMRMTLEEARQFGAVYGVCCCCSRTLTDELSIYLGIGPVCGKREFGETFKFQLAEAKKKMKK